MRPPFIAQDGVGRVTPYSRKSPSRAPLSPQPPPSHLCEPYHPFDLSPLSHLSRHWPACSSLGAAAWRMEGEAEESSMAAGRPMSTVAGPKEGAVDGLAAIRVLPTFTRAPVAAPRLTQRRLEVPAARAMTAGAIVVAAATITANRRLRRRGSGVGNASANAAPGRGTGIGICCQFFGEQSPGSSASYFIRWTEETSRRGLLVQVVPPQSPHP
jgi:hypothetical protein